MEDVSNKTSKENILKYLPDVLDSLFANDKNFLN